jgi:hypothetical protein
VEVCETQGQVELTWQETVEQPSENEIKVFTTPRKAADTNHQIELRTSCRQHLQLMQQVSPHVIMTGHGFSKRATMRHIAANSSLIEPSFITDTSHDCSKASSCQALVRLDPLHQVKCCVGQNFKVQMSSHKVTLHTRCLLVRHRAVDAGLCNGVAMNAGTPLAGSAVNHFYTFANQLARLAALAPLVVGKLLSLYATEGARTREKEVRADARTFKCSR